MRSGEVRVIDCTAYSADDLARKSFALNRCVDRIRQKAWPHFSRQLFSTFDVTDKSAKRLLCIKKQLFLLGCFFAPYMLFTILCTIHTSCTYNVMSRPNTGALIFQILLMSIIAPSYLHRGKFFYNRTVLQGIVPSYSYSITVGIILYTAISVTNLFVLFFYRSQLDAQLFLTMLHNITLLYMIIGLIIAIPSLSKSVRTERLDAYTNLMLRRVSHAAIHPVVVHEVSSDLKPQASDDISRENPESKQFDTKESIDKPIAN